MATTTGLTNVAKQAAADAVCPSGSVLKGMLIKVGAAGTYDQAYATAYPGAGSWVDEVAAGNGYTQGGITLSGRAGGPASNQGYVDFADLVWNVAAGQTLSATGLAIWDSTLSRWVAFVDFGGTMTVAVPVGGNASTFTVQIPGDGGNGLVRFP